MSINRSSTRMPSNSAVQQRIGTLGRHISLKIAFEEFIGIEYDFLAQQHEDVDLKTQTRFIAVDALLLRPNETIGPIWYEFTSEGDVWVILSQPIIKKLDQNLLYLLVKLIIDTISQYRKANGELSIKEAENKAYNNYIEDMKRIRGTKALQTAERLKQVLHILMIEKYQTGYPILDPKSRIPPSDKKIQKKLNLSFARVKAKLFSFAEKQEITFKFRVIPYLFQEIITDSNLISEDSSVVRIKPLYSLIAIDITGKPSFAIILISTHFLEELAKESNTISNDYLDYMLAYEIYSVLSSIKYQRGGMEQEIYNFMSKNRDSAEESLYRKYSKNIIAKSKLQVDKLLNNLVLQKTPILRIYD